LQSSKNKFYSKLSNTTRWTNESESEDNYSITDLLKDQIEGDGKTECYHDYFNKMMCS
jgi:hypothetical protein